MGRTPAPSNVLFTPLDIHQIRPIMRLVTNKFTKVESIKAAANCSLRYVFDTIGNSSSSGTASQAISEQGGSLCTVRPGKAFTENVTKQTKVTDVLVWTAFLKEHKYKEFYWPVSHLRRPTFEVVY